MSASVVGQRHTRLPHILKYGSILVILHTDISPPSLPSCLICRVQTTMNSKTFTLSLLDHSLSNTLAVRNAPWPGLSCPLPPPLPELCLSDDPTNDDVLLPQEQIRTEVATPAQFLSSFTMQLIKQRHHLTPFPYTRPTPSQSNSTSYSTADNNISFHHSFLIPNQIPTSQFPQEHGYPFSIHPHYTRSIDLPGIRGCRAGCKMELHTTGTIGDCTTHILSDYPLPDCRARPFGDHATYILGDHTVGMTSGGVGSFENFNGSKCHSEQVVGARSWSSPPPNQPLEFHSHDHLSLIEGGNLSGEFHHARRFATPQSLVPTRLPEAHSVFDRDVYNPCGWWDDNNRQCGVPISSRDCADHFAAVHDIKNIAWHVEVICRWCSSEAQKKVIRKNLLRHLREVHLHCRRSENRIYLGGFSAGSATGPLSSREHIVC